MRHIDFKSGLRAFLIVLLFWWAISHAQAQILSSISFGGALPTDGTPTFSPGAGTYSSTQSVTISTITSGATLCYTTDGTTPTATVPGTCSHGTTYSTAVSVSSSLTLKAIATKLLTVNSAVGSAAYTISAITYVTETSAAAANTSPHESVTSTAADFSGCATNCLLVAVCSGDNATVNMSDSVNGAWSAPDATLFNAIRIFHFANASTSSSQTFTCSAPSAAYPAEVIYAFNGAAASGALDGTPTVHQATASTIQPGAITTLTNTGDVCVTGIQFGTSTTLTINESFSTPVEVPYATGIYGVAASYLLNCTNSTNPTWSGSNIAYNVLMAAYQP